MISASIVTFKHKIEELDNLIVKIISSKLVLKLFIIDNSPSNELQKHINYPKTEYTFLNRNDGYGSGHNVALRKAFFEINVQYHLVINPDINFEEGTIEKIGKYMEQNSDVGLLMPKVLHPNGQIQYLPKLLPSPLDLIIRRFSLFRSVFSKRLHNYEMRTYSKAYTFNTPVISGCFSCFRIDALKLVGLYDEAYFMYFEDFDLSRRIHKLYETIYFSEAIVYHNYTRGAQKNLVLFKIFIRSAFVYFNKWGWIFDHERKYFNKKTLTQKILCPS